MTEPTSRGFFRKPLKNSSDWRAGRDAGLAGGFISTCSWREGISGPVAFIARCEVRWRSTLAARIRRLDPPGDTARQLPRPLAPSSRGVGVARGHREREALQQRAELRPARRRPRSAPGSGLRPRGSASSSSRAGSMTRLCVMRAIIGCSSRRPSTNASASELRVARRAGSPATHGSISASVARASASRSTPGESTSRSSSSSRMQCTFGGPAGNSIGEDHLEARVLGRAHARARAVLDVHQPQLLELLQRLADRSCGSRGAARPARARAAAGRRGRTSRPGSWPGSVPLLRSGEVDGASSRRSRLHDNLPPWSGPIPSALRTSRPRRSASTATSASSTSPTRSSWTSSSCARWGRATSTCASSRSRASTTSTTRCSADTDSIAAARGGKIYPGNSAVGEVLAVGAEVKRFKPGDIVLTHCNGEPDHYGYPAADLGLRPARVDRLVRRGGGGRRLAARAGAARLRPVAVGDRRAAAARADRLPPVAPRARHLPPEGARHEAAPAERAVVRRRRRRVLPDAREVRGPPRVLLLGLARAARRARAPGHPRHRPEGVQPLRVARRRARLLGRGPQAHRRREHAHRLRHAARPGVRRRARGRRRAAA